MTNEAAKSTFLLEHCAERCNRYQNDDTCKNCEINVAIEALEKQISKKPKEYEDKYYACPNCGNAVMMKWERYNKVLMDKSNGLPYCLVCGQAIDWEVEK